MESADSINAISSSVTATHGPLVGGKDLINVLGFKTPSAFRRAVRMGMLTIHTFEIEGRRGRFALSKDVDDWLATLKKTNTE